MEYKAIIGLEIHCELKTESKMFCTCKNNLELNKTPNINICPICSGQPGALPSPNKKAIESVIKTGLSLNCQIAKKTKFDRKNYFYPDLPKGYQISQFDQPLCYNGYLNINNNKITIQRIHLEEDTAKLIHNRANKTTLIDYNRAGAPLMELVTNPDIRDSQTAKNFCIELQNIFQYLEISNADMEKGQMRCEVNISLIPKNDPLIPIDSGTKVEIKNINSFKAVQKAIDYEIKRQTELLNTGEKILQETRGWDEDKNQTISQRIKETSADYRYFPEPDISQIQINHFKTTKKPDLNTIYLKNIKADIPELPLNKKERLIAEYKLDTEDANILTANKDLSYYTESVLTELQEWYNSTFPEKKNWAAKKASVCKMATGWLTSKFLKLLQQQKQTVNQCLVTPENFSELIIMLYNKEITSAVAQNILKIMVKKGSDPSQVVDEQNLRQISSSQDLSLIVDKIIKNFDKQVQQYKSGKENVIQFLLGQVMRETKGKSDPKMVIDILKQKLNE